MSSAHRNSLLIASPDSHTIRKVPQPNAIGHDVLTQKRIHFLAQEVLRPENNFDILRAPCLVPHSMNSYDYVMERVDTSFPIFPRENECMAVFTQDQRQTLERELVRFWARMWEHGFAPWGYDLFYQPDGSVVLLDFDKFAFRRNQGWGPLSLEFPYQDYHDQYRHFFEFMGFPERLEERLLYDHDIRIRYPEPQQ